VNLGARSGDKPIEPLANSLFVRVVLFVVRTYSQNDEVRVACSAWKTSAGRPRTHLCGGIRYAYYTR